MYSRLLRSSCYHSFAKLFSISSATAILLLICITFSSSGYAQMYPKHKRYYNNSSARYYDSIDSLLYLIGEKMDGDFNEVVVSVALASLYLEAELRYDTKSPDYWIAKSAIVYMQTTDSVQATKCALKAIEIAPEYAWAYYNYAQVLTFFVADEDVAPDSILRPTYRKALMYVNRAIARGIQSDFYALKSYLLIKLDLMDDAYDLAEQALDISQESYFAHLALLSSSTEKLSEDDWFDAVNTAISYFPRKIALWEIKASYALIVDQKDSFLNAAHALFSLLPDTPYRSETYLAYKELKDAKDFSYDRLFSSTMTESGLAVEDVKKTQRKYPDSLKYMYAIGYAYNEAGNRILAFKYLKKAAMAPNPERYNALNLLVSIYFDDEDPDSLIKYSNLIIDLYPDDYLGYGYLAHAFRDDDKRFIKYTNECMDRFPNEGYFDYILANKYYRMGLYEKAFDHIYIALYRKSYFKADAYVLKSEIMYKLEMLDFCEGFFRARAMDDGDSYNESIVRQPCIGSDL